MKRVLSALLVCPALAGAQTPDCANPVTQVGMNACAARAYAEADDALNAAYRASRDRARAMDQYLAPGDTPAEIVLRDAQRAWIPFRDAACEAESLIVRGGSLQPLIFYTCLERLTRQRTEDLQIFGEMN